jgi:FtsP/CotA-like multicopper oxidase with cupredoxin domain
LLRRQKLNADAYFAAWNPQLPPGSGPAPIAADPYLLGSPIPPDSNETGFKDTVRANPGEVTTIIARFDDYTGTYPWHCHIIEHEDNEMMLQFEVATPPNDDDADRTE